MNEIGGNISHVAAMTEQSVRVVHKITDLMGFLDRPSPQRGHAIPGLTVVIAQARRIAKNFSQDPNGPKKTSVSPLRSPHAPPSMAGDSRGVLRSPNPIKTPTPT